MVEKEKYRKWKIRKMGKRSENRGPSSFTVGTWKDPTCYSEYRKQS
jgi:hypothetical protein